MPEVGTTQQFMRGRPVTVKHCKLRPGQRGSYGSDYISIRDELIGRCHCETVVHEALHACIPDLSETPVRETADAISKLLWKLGYRRFAVGESAWAIK